MNNIKTKQLSFEPVYHRRVSRDKYTRVNTAIKHGSGDNKSESEEAEREQIIQHGFNVVDIDMERPFAKIERSDKGDVVSVLANTNPLFKMSS